MIKNASQKTRSLQQLWRARPPQKPLYGGVIGGKKIKVLLLVMAVEIGWGPIGWGPPVIFRR